MCEIFGFNLPHQAIQIFFYFEVPLSTSDKLELNYDQSILILVQYAST